MPLGGVCAWSEGLVAVPRATDRRHRRVCVHACLQVLVSLAALGQAPSTALAQHYFDASLPLLGAGRVSADSIAAVLAALQDTKLQPDAAWLEAVVATVRSNIRQYSVLQLNGVAKALACFQEGGMRRPWLQDFLAFLREFFLY